MDYQAYLAALAAKYQTSIQVIDVANCAFCDVIESDFGSGSLCDYIELVKGLDTAAFEKLSSQMKVG